MSKGDYAERFLRAEDRNGELIAIWLDFHNEAVRLIQERRAKTLRAVAEVLREQQGKWLAFARKVEGVRHDGFLGIYETVAAGEIPALQPMQELYRRCKKEGLL